MSSPTRLALAVALALVPLAGCSFSSDNVSCSGTSCTATLKGDGASAQILGTTVKFSGVQNGRATLGVGDASVSCAQGERVGAGPLSVTCTRVTDSEVQLTASLG